MTNWKKVFLKLFVYVVVSLSITFLNYVEKVLIGKERENKNKKE